MWKNQYYNLYNKLESNKSMQDFYDQVNSSISSQPRVITVSDVSAAVNQQKKKYIKCRPKWYEITNV